MKLRYIVILFDHKRRLVLNILQSLRSSRTPPFSNNVVAIRQLLDSFLLVATTKYAFIYI